MVVACAGFSLAASAQDWERDRDGYLNRTTRQPTSAVTPKVKRAPRATVVATPTPVPRAALVSTPTPSATPTSTPTPASRSSPSDQPVTSRSRPSEVAASPPTSVPAPVVEAPQDQAPDIPWGGILLFVVLLVGGFVANRNAARTKKQKTARQPRKTVVYHDYTQSQRAHQLWRSQGSLFVQEEAARVAA
jgi:hypothetical protein